ncbi:hypothetical protein FJZ21_02080 [Candidatus Pacearchaeota archaeon]|nr:hypothetical protein [Candidatus Pacearchaeota archaeon]
MINTKFKKGQIPHNKINFKEEDIEKILNLYFNSKYSHSEIARIYSINASTIGDLLKRLGKKSRKSGKRLGVAKKLTRKELEELYINQKNSVNKISSKLGVSKDTIKHWIISYNLHYRGIGNRKLPKLFQRPSKEELERLHHIDKNSKNNIALKFGVSKTTISRWFKEYEITPKLYTKHSNIELIMKSLLENNNLIEGLKEQYVIKLSKGYTRADFAFPNQKIAIYCDGDYWHGNWHSIGKNKDLIKEGPRKKHIFEKTVVKDGRIHFELMSLGWVTLRFTEQDIKNNGSSIMEIIKKNLFDKEFIKNRKLEITKALYIRKKQGL